MDKRIIWFAVLALFLAGLAYVGATHPAASQVFMEWARIGIFLGLFYGVKWVWDRFTKKKGEKNEDRGLRP